jgi:hypothetical protein
MGMQNIDNFKLSWRLDCRQVANTFTVAAQRDVPQNLAEG